MDTASSCGLRLSSSLLVASIFMWKQDLNLNSKKEFSFWNLEKLKLKKLNSLKEKHLQKKLYQLIKIILIKSKKSPHVQQEG